MKVILLTVAAWAMLFGIAFLIAWPLASYNCFSKWAGTYETKYNPLSGCRVHIHGKWVPAENVREF